MKKTFDVKYDIGEEYYLIVKNIKVKGKIDQYRIIVEKDKIKIHYLMIVPEYELMDRVSSNGVWIPENMLIVENN